MRHLLACLAMLAAFNVTAQTETSNFPYNPDVDQDGIIGVADILQLLSTFGQAFQVQVTLNSDSTSAVFFPSDWTQYMTRTQCASRCDSLPGPWHIMTSQGFETHLTAVRDSIEAYPNASSNYGSEHAFHQLGWGDMINSGGDHLPSLRLLRDPTDDNFWTRIDIFPDDISVSDSRLCLCELRQRPRVEYSQCQGDPQSVLDCVEEKTQQGWYPLDLIPFGSNSMLQTMWRWAD